MTLRAGFLNINDDFNQQLQAELKKFKVEFKAVIAAIVEAPFATLVFETPQWSGTLAASWNLSVNRANYFSSENFPEPENPYKKGDLPAINESLSRVRGFRERFIASGWIIEVTNGAEHASQVNSGEYTLRKDAGHSPGFVDRFIQTVESTVVNSHNWKHYAYSNFLGA